MADDTVPASESQPADQPVALSEAQGLAQPGEMLRSAQYDSPLPAQDAPTGAGQPATFWERFPWRRWLGALAGAATLALAIGSFVLPLRTQIVWTQFAIPAYVYTCIGLAAVAICELHEPRGRRVLMLVLLLALTLLGVLGFAAGGVGPLLILATHVGFLIGWMAWPTRTTWTLLWLVEALAWVAIAVAQGRLL